MDISTEAVLESPLGAELSADDAAVLGALLEEKSLSDGDYLVREGTADDRLYIVLDGKLEVVKSAGAGEFATLAVLREGDIAGGLSFIDGTAHSVSLRALCDSRVASLRREDFERLIDEHPRLVYNVMRVMARSAHGTMQRMNHDFMELSNYIFKQHGRY